MKAKHLPAYIQGNTNTKQPQYNFRELWNNYTILSGPDNHHSTGLELELEQSGWTMSAALVQNQGWPPAEEAHMEFTTVTTLRMWLYTAVLQVILMCRLIFLPYSAHLRTIANVGSVALVLTCTFLVCSSLTYSVNAQIGFIAMPLALHLHTDSQLLVTWGWCEMDLPAGPTHLVVWKSTTVDAGGLCVMTFGLQLTLMWLVVSLGFLVLLLQPVTAQVFPQGEISL